MKKTAPLRVDNLYGDNGILICPRCRGENLHHTSVEVFNRSEDDPLARVTLAGQDETSVSVRDAKDNPSSRRHGFKVYFFCEGCCEWDEPEFSLTFAQHKGITISVWEWECRDNFEVIE